MMKRLKILGVILIAVVGAILIYNHFDNIKTEDENYNKFASEYTLLDNTNIYNSVSIDEVLNTLSNGTGIIFLCTPESVWCQRYALYLNDAMKESNVTEIKYLNIKDYRELNTTKYQKLVDLLENYVYKDDIGNTKIYMPDLTIVKNGNIIFHNNDTSLVASDADIDDYYTDEKINELKNKFKEAVILLNSEEEIIDNIDENNIVEGVE